MTKHYGVDELISIIDHCALDLMNAPITTGKKADGTPMNMAETSNYNSMIAMENNGIRLLAIVLIDKLTETGDKEADPDG